MIYKINYTIIICIFLLTTQSVLAQKSSKNTPLSNLQLLARKVNDSTVVLRWAPTNHTDWRLVNRQGYRLERAVLDDSTNAIVEKYTPLSKEPIRAWTEAECRAKINPKTDRFAAITAQAIHGKTFSTRPEGDDGNTIKAITSAAEEEENRHLIALFCADVSPLAAEAAGLRFEDKNVTWGYKYVYRLVAVPHPQGLYKLDTAGFVMSFRDAEPLPQMRDIKAEGFDAKIQLTWLKELEINNLSAFFVERSEDGTNFTPLSNEPFVFFPNEKAAENTNLITYTDTTILNYKTYYYRVRGIDAFGDYSPYSTPITAKGRDLTPVPPPYLKQIDKRTPTAYTVKWDMAKSEMTDLKGFYVMRSDRIDGQYLPLNKGLLPPTERQFTDTTASATLKNFYAIIAVDTAGNVSPSESRLVFSYDETPPAKPRKLTGKIDTNGVVTIRWEVGNELDLKGYYVFFANSRVDEFAAANPNLIVDSLFTDTIRLDNLTRQIYYKITAIDNNLNSSEYSDILELIKPDLVPPVPPVIGAYVVSDSTVTFEWAKSASADVAKQNVFRRLAPNGDWERLASVNPTTERYLDRNFGRDKSYFYSIEAEDSSGLKSPKSYPLSIKTLSANLSNLTAQNVVATLNSDKKAANLTWQTPKTEEKIADWLIFRTTEEGKWDLLTSTAVANFEDRNLSNRKEVKYAVKARFGNGVVSNLVVSNVLKIP